ncbi:MAG: hypothetical protein AAF657_31760 [Acidobacteriota bacterium]
MTEARWKRLTGFCLLAALALQGAAATANDASPDPGPEIHDHWVLCQLALLPPDRPAAKPPLLVFEGTVEDDPTPAIAVAVASPQLSRGPPA